jgi:citrate lyase beta subunit
VAAAATTGTVLGISALTTRARSAGLAWFAVIAVGSAAAALLGAATGEDWPALLSWTDGLGDVAARLAGQSGPDLEFAGWARALLLLAVSAAGIAFVDWRLRRAEGGERG